MSKDRRSKEYEEGVEYFINFALQHCPKAKRYSLSMYAMWKLNTSYTYQDSITYVFQWY